MTKKNKFRNHIAAKAAAGLAVLIIFLTAWIALAGTDIVTFYNSDNKKLTAFKIEIADNGESRAHGLMNRQALDRDSGMLFVFDYPQIVGMWMKNTEIPLDMIFIDKDNTVKCIRKNTVPQSLNVLTCMYKALYVLEINAGLADAYGISPGDKVKIRK